MISSQLMLALTRRTPPVRTTAARCLSSSSSLYPHYEIRQTRWNDNDEFGHINNAVYYNIMDDAINMQLLNHGIDQKYPRFIAENGMQFFRSIAFPASVKVGLRVVQLGTSSVAYQVGFFERKQQSPPGDEDDDDDDDALAAQGKFVHVYMDASTGRPMPIPEEARSVLRLLIPKEDDDNEKKE